MVESVHNRTLFHLTESKPYKEAFVTGQKLHIGDSYTPFFGFYENARTYPATQSDGSIVQVPAIKFLNHVEAGNIHCPARSELRLRRASASGDI